MDRFRRKGKASHLGPSAKFAFNAHELVVLGHAFGTRERANLDLPDMRTHGKVGFEGQLSPNRANGLYAMVARIRQLAVEALAA